MEIDSILTSRKAEIAKKWVNLVLNTYDSSTFFKTQKDRIANPVGTNISEALHLLYDLLCRRADIQELIGPLDTIVRIRAVQDFSPSQAVAFLFALKNVVREEITKQGSGQINGLFEFEAAVDQAALAAFDIYMGCKERLFRIRLNELRSGTHVLTDGTQCASALLKRKLKESADNHQNNSST